MDTLIDLRTGHWCLLVVPHSQNADLLVIAARLAERGPLMILDGGNLSNVHVMARHANWDLGVLKRIRISRAFTCYQMASMLEGARADGAPLLLLDFLNTFYDENVPMYDRERLLKRCLEQIDFLSKGSGLLASINPPPRDAKDSLSLFRRMVAGAPRVLVADQPAVVEHQERLF